MGGLVDPEHFGCASKLPFDETVSLAVNIGEPGVSDFSVIKSTGMIALSVDRIYQCSSDFDVFAAIALNHVINDTNVSFAEPCQASIAFEYGGELTSEERLKLAEAFRNVLRERGMELGKCHSSVSPGITSVTVTVAARNPQIDLERLATGTVYLGRPLGWFKLHYLAEMNLWEGGTAYTALLQRPFPVLDPTSGVARVSDVSGHGVAGTLYNLSQKYELDMEVTLTPRLAAHPLVLSEPMPCFQNALQHYDLDGIEIDEEAWRLAGLMETAGPLIGLVNDGTALSGDPFGSGHLLPIGRFRSGARRLKIKWQN